MPISSTWKKSNVNSWMRLLQLCLFLKGNLEIDLLIRFKVLISELITRLLAWPLLLWAGAFVPHLRKQQKAEDAAGRTEGDRWRRTEEPSQTSAAIRQKWQFRASTITHFHSPDPCPQIQSAPFSSTLFFFTSLLVFRGPGPDRQLLTGRKNSLWTGSRRRSLTDLPFKPASPQPPADSLHTLIQLDVFILYPQGNWNPLASPQISSLWPDGQRCHPYKGSIRRRFLLQLWSPKVENTSVASVRMTASSLSYTHAV